MKNVRTSHAPSKPSPIHHRAEQTRLERALKKLNVHDHICLIYRTPEEQFAAAIPFIRIGLERGEKCVYIADDNSVQVVVDAMTADGVDVKKAMRTGALMIATKKDSYLRHGYFDPADMIQFLTDAAIAAKKEGYKALRATGEMTWALGGDPGADRLIEYEAKLNVFFAKYDCLALCQYNRNKFSSEWLTDVIRTHPLVVYGNTVCRNFYYEPAEDVLKKGHSQNVERLLANLLEREHLQEQLESEKKILNKAQQIARMGSWKMDVLTRSIEWSDEMFTLYERDKKLGPPTEAEAIKYYAPNDAVSLEAIARRVAETKKEESSEVAVRLPSGAQAFFNITFSPVKNGDETVTQLIGTVQDVTQKKLGIAKLTQLASFPELNPNPIVEIDAAGTFIYINPAAKQQFPNLAAKGVHHPFVSALKNHIANIKRDPHHIAHDAAAVGDQTYQLTIAWIPTNNAYRIYGNNITEQKKISEALQKSEEEYRRIVSTASEGVWVLGPDTKTTFVNARLQEMLGYTNEEIVGHPMTDFFFKEDLADHRKKMENRKKGISERYERRLRKKDGSTIWTIVAATPTFDHQHQFIGSFALLTDITERKIAEETIQASEEKFSKAFYTSAVLMAITTLDEGRIIDINDAYQKVLGRTREECIGRTTAELKIWANPAQRSAALAKIKKDGHVRDIEVQLRKPSGEIRTVLLSMSPIKVNGKTQLLSVAADITERQRTERALRSSSLYARSLIEASLDPLVTINKEGKITDVNTATEQVTGVPRATLIGTDFSDYFTEPEKARKGYKRVFKEGFVKDYPLAIRHTSGKITDVLYNATTYTDTAGNVLGVFAAARDITEQKKAETEREQFKKFFNSSGDIMVIADPNGAFKRINPATKELLGYTEKELIAKPFIDFVYAEDKQPTLDEMARQQKIGSSMNFENRYVCKDGSLRWISWRADYDKKENLTYATGRDVTASKEASQKILQSEMRLIEAQRVANVGSWHWDAIADKITWSDQYYRIVGLTPGTPTPNYANHLKMYSPATAALLDKAVQAATKNGTPYELELKLVSPPRWLLARGEAIKDSKGKIIALQGTLLDITERKSLQEEVQRRNRALSVISAGNRALVHAQTEAEIFKQTCDILVNTGGYRMAWIGIAEQDANKTVSVVASAGFDNGYLKIINVVWSDAARGKGPTGTAIRTKETVVARDLSTQPNYEPWRVEALKRGYASSIALPLFYENELFGALTIYASETNAFINKELELLEEMANDVSYGISVLRLRKKQKHAEEKLLQDAEEINDLYQHAPCGYHSLDANGVFLRINDTELKMLGYAREDIVGKKKFSDLTTPEDALKFKKIFPIFKKQGFINAVEYNMVRKDGSIVPVTISASALTDANGVFVASRGVVVDISERRKIEEKSQEVDRLKNKFIQIVSHQIRTPLSVIRWNLETILNRQRGLVPESQEEALRSSYAANLEIIARINDLIVAMDIEENRFRVELEQTDMNELFQSVCEEKLRAADVKRITTRIQPPTEPLPNATIDATKIRDVIARLIDNAITYTPDGGSINVAYFVQNDNIRFEITDTGVGIPTSEQPRIFERFHRGWNAATMKPNASGLSLYIAKHYLESMHGKIGFSSKEKNGSTFWFELPIA